MNQTIPATAGAGSLLTLGGAAQAAPAGDFVAGAENVFGAFMGRTVNPESANADAEYLPGGEELPTAGEKLPSAAASFDAPDAALGSAADTEAESVASSLGGDTLAQIEGFLAVEFAPTGSVLQAIRPAGDKSLVLPGAIAPAASAESLPGAQVVERDRWSVLPDSLMGSPAATAELSARPASGFAVNAKADVAAPSALSAQLAPGFQVGSAVQGNALVETQGAEVNASGRFAPLNGQQRQVDSLAEGLRQAVTLAATDADSRQDGGLNGVALGADRKPENETPGRLSAALNPGVVLPPDIRQQAVESTGLASAQAVQDVAGSRSDVSEVPLVAPVQAAVDRPLDSAAVAVESGVAERRGQAAALDLGRPAERPAIPGGEGNSALAERLARSSPVAAAQDGSDTQGKVSGPAVAADNALFDKPAGDGRGETLVESLAATVAGTSKAAKPQAEPYQLQLPNDARPGMPAWSKAINERVVWLSSQQGQSAEIRLDPPELGSLQIKLQVKNDQVSVVFHTPHGSVRDALEQSMPRLREMFEEQGLSLADSSVEDQSAGSNREGSEERRAGAAGYAGLDGEDESAGAESLEAQSLSLVDYYA